MTNSSTTSGAKAAARRRDVPREVARKKLGASDDARALDQRVRGPRARALGWAPTLHWVATNVPRLLEEFRRAQERAA